MSATEAREKTEADEKFQIAIDVLSAYERKHHPYIMESSVAKVMDAARVKDNSSSMDLKRLEENSSVSERISSSLPRILILIPSFWCGNRR